MVTTSPVLGFCTTFILSFLILDSSSVIVEFFYKINLAKEKAYYLNHRIELEALSFLCIVFNVQFIKSSLGIDFGKLVNGHLADVYFLAALSRFNFIVALGARRGEYWKLGFFRVTQIAGEGLKICHIPRIFSVFLLFLLNFDFLGMDHF